MLDLVAYAFSFGLNERNVKNTFAEYHIKQLKDLIS